MLIRNLGLAVGSGPGHMALDEALLQGQVDPPTDPSVDSGDRAKVDKPTPSLRFFGWSEPWVSLGGAQSVGDLVLPSLEGEGIGLLRRASGGTAVLHEAALGFSLALPIGTPLSPLDITYSYRAFGEIALLAVRSLGVESAALVAPEEADRGGRAPWPGGSACMAGLAPFEVTSGGRKLVGHSQLRRRNALLYHAIVYLRFDHRRFANLLRTADDEEREALVELLERRITSLESETGRPISLAETSEAFKIAFLAAKELLLIEGSPTEAEITLAEGLLASRYANREWTYRR